MIKFLGAVGVVSISLFIAGFGYLYWQLGKVRI